MTVAFVAVRVTEDLDKGSWNRLREHWRRRIGDIRANSFEGFCGKGMQKCILCDAQTSLILCLAQAAQMV